MYDKSEIFDQMKKIIPINHISRIYTLCNAVGISQTQFYEWMPKYPEETKHIKDLIQAEKSKKYDACEYALFQTKSPTGLIALMKLYGSKEERDILSDRTELSEQIERNKGKILEWLESQISDKKNDE